MLPWRGSRLALRSYGDGPAVTLCLHGFLEDSESFAALAKALPGHRLLAPDMPFHGMTEWNEDDRLRPEDLVEILMQCPELQTGRFGLLGYSMGGKTALSLFERMPERISHLLLVAPDGLRRDPWNDFFTRTLLGKRILRDTMHDPRWFNVLLDTLRRVRLVNESLYRFTISYLGDPEIRSRVYRVWMTLREFRPRRDRLTEIIQRHQTPVRLVFGRYDRLCPVRIGEDFVRRLDGQARMDILDSGHLLLRGKNVLSLAEAFPTLPAN